MSSVTDANTPNTPVRNMILQQSGMNEDELVGALNVSPLKQNTPRGNIPTEFEVHYMTPDGTRVSPVVTVSMNDLMEAFIQNHPTVRDEYKAFHDSNSKYVSALNDIMSGKQDATEFFEAFNNTQGQEDFRMFNIYYNNLGPNRKNQWDKFMSDQVKERLEYMGGN
jgi:hypothetical protein